MSVALTVGVLAGSIIVDRAGDTVRPFDAVAAALLVVGCLVTVERRRRPLPVAIVAALCCVAYYGMFYPGIFAAAPVMLAVYTLAGEGRRGGAIGVSAGFLALMYLALTVSTRQWGDPAVLNGLGWLFGWLVAVFAIGEMVHHRRRYIREVEQRLRDAERIREEAELRRAAEERLWIAQELHDTLTHSISVINVQAGVAVHLMDGDTQPAAEALAAIKDASQDALRELRSTLGVLREGDTERSGLALLDSLVRRARSAGLTIVVKEQGPPRRLPFRVDQTAYRIVQEALTNVLRHAGTVPVTIGLDYGPTWLTVSVANDGDPVPVTSDGIGLIGMRERVVSVGGTFAAGSRETGGFSVTARLPADQPLSTAQPPSTVQPLSADQPLSTDQQPCTAHMPYEDGR